MTHRDTLVVGASAGGVEALRAFVGGLPSNLAACVLVVLHLPANSSSVLPAILNRAGPLAAKHADDGEVLEPGRVYVAPPDHHLLVRGDRTALSRGPRENGHRPAVDPLFRSAAESRSNRVIATVLSGSLDDGTAGCAAVRAKGGLVAVQEPGDALYDSMPRGVMAVLQPDLIASAGRLATLVTQRTGESVGVPPQVPVVDDERMRLENLVSAMDAAAFGKPDRPGTPSGFSCPDCDGALFEFDEIGNLRFRCRVGHAWSAVGLLARQDSALERALWLALRNLEEKVALCVRMADLARQRGNHRSAARYDESRAEARRAVETMTSVLVTQPARFNHVEPGD